MKELQEGEQRPVWVKAVLINDGGVERIVPLNLEGQEEWAWMMLEGEVQHVPRSRQVLEEDITVLPPDRVAAKYPQLPMPADGRGPWGVFFG